MGATGIIGKSAKIMKSISLETGLSEIDFNYCMNRIIKRMHSNFVLPVLQKKQRMGETTLLSW